MSNKRKRNNSMTSAVDEDRMLLAVPKKGRLYERCLKLLKGAGIEYTRANRLDIAFAKDLPIKLVFLPAKDIASFVGESHVDLGITGQDMVKECDVEVEELLETGFGKCRLSILSPKLGPINNPKQLANKRISTSFPVLTENFFKELFKKDLKKMPSIKYISGSVEAACALGLADAVVDLIETGTTAKAAGLEEIETIMVTQTVLIANPHSKHPELVEKIRKRMTGFLMAQKHEVIYYNIEKTKLEAAKKITPGKRSATVAPLEDPNWVSVSAMVKTKQVSKIMDQLEDIGAHDIFVLNLANMRD